MRPESIQPVSKPKRRLFLGPGTILAIVAAVGIAVFGPFRDRPTADPNAGRTLYAADAMDRMRPVVASTATQQKPPLWKPEIALLLQHAAELQLSRRQKQQIEALDAAWKQEKAALEEAMRHAVSEAEGQQKEAQAYHSASAGRITESLSDYSHLSHQFNERRASCWLQALTTLTPKQQTALERMTASGRKGTSL